MSKREPRITLDTYGMDVAQLVTLYTLLGHMKDEQAEIVFHILTARIGVMETVRLCNAEVNPR